MKRRLVLLLLLLVGGAIVNVAVAWAAAAYSPPSDDSDALRYNSERRSDVDKWWLSNNPFTERAVPTDSYTNSSLGLELVTMWRNVPGSQNSGEMTAYCLRTGWPTLAMCGSRWVYLPVYDSNFKSTVVHGIEIVPAHVSELQEEVTFLMDGRLLPIRPIWPGFAINTVFYAFILWLLFAGPFVVRRWRRIRRGLCPKCAYDLRASDSATCPECGATR